MLPRLLPVFLAAFTLAAPAMAQTAPTLEKDIATHKTDNKNYVSLSMENDLFNGADRYYTSGVRASWFNAETQVPDVIDDIADSIPGFEINESTGTMFSIGQNLYTPEDITTKTVNPKDRPYAAWLYGSIGMATVKDNRVDELEMTLGVVGPEALGEPTQKYIHRHLSGSPKPQGWDHQLKFEPGVILSWQRRWPQTFTAHTGDYYVRAIPNVNASVGNIYTYAGTGMTFTFGPYQDRLQDTPPRVRPSMPGTGYFNTSDDDGDDLSWFLFASVDGRAMARNIFLDGNTFADSPSVDKKPLVGDLSLGAAITFADYRLSYATNFRSEEFDGQDDPSVFSSLTLSTRF